MDLQFLFRTVEHVDQRIGELFAGAPLAVALATALLLGLRHATDPDHLVAVTSLVAADDGRVSGAARIGAWWGLGHACTLLAVGLPLVLAKSALPPWVEVGAERAVGAVIVLLAVRVLVKWRRGDYRADRHRHGSDGVHRHLRPPGPHRHERWAARRAFAIGVLHGVAGTGAVAVLLVAAVPGTIEAAAALAVFAPASIASMAVATGAFAWVLTRPGLQPLYRGIVIPMLGTWSALFGAWYLGLG